MNDYKPNSNRFKEEQKQAEQDKKVEKVVTGPVVTRKKSGLSKFAGEFISEDAKNIKSYVLGDVLIPAIKKALCDIVTDGINMLLYGDTKAGYKRSTADKFSYSSISRDTRAVRDSRYGYNVSSYSYDDIVLASRGEAETVLDRMCEILDVYKTVSVAELKDLVGITPAYTDNKYGWINLATAEVVRVRDGYMLKLPRAIPID